MHNTSISLIKWVPLVPSSPSYLYGPEDYTQIWARYLFLNRFYLIIYILNIKQILIRLFLLFYFKSLYYYKTNTILNLILLLLN
jgi:hypothetical protein